MTLTFNKMYGKTILLVKKVFPSKSFTVPVKVWERANKGKSSNRIRDFGI